MLQPDPLAMLTGAALFLAVLVVMLAVTAVRRRSQRRPQSGPARDAERERRFAG